MASAIRDQPASVSPAPPRDDVPSPTGQITSDGTLPSALFILPFPAPISAHMGEEPPSFLMYAPPRSVYQRPPKTADGKRPKEKISRKVVRRWQEEVLMGQQIKRGTLKNPTCSKKIRGGCTRAASSISSWLSNSCVETLSHLPPRRKLGGVTIIHPAFAQSTEEGECDGAAGTYQPTAEELTCYMGVLLRKTRKHLLTKVVISGMLLPITLAIDVIAVPFSFEINVCYFAFQLQALKKCKALTPPQSQQSKLVKRLKNHSESTSHETTVFVGNPPAEVPQDEMQIAKSAGTFQSKPVDQHALEPVMTLLYNICAELDPISFPQRQGVNLDSSTSSQTSTLPPSLKSPDKAVAKGMIQAFRDTLPPEVAGRYVLDEDILSEDLARYLKKASKEYVASLGGRGSGKGLMHRFKARRQQSASKKEQKLVITRHKEEAKKEDMELDC
ncbi:hypothetical protein MJO28_003150 [Puccinia striiformis f. sp. tritici]|uniref:Uncharacterized protein n=1 Tax=Puccinia striiformis f. sp. tritici TaxID=168172 RepID=A0ACC0ESC2_9BASI|nr:hypothetical protein MJO28_003150 [Puccinia striiformis f. sp. tritici]